MQATMKFGEFFKRRRIALGLTLRAFCRSNALAPGNISRLAGISGVRVRRAYLGTQWPPGDSHPAMRNHGPPPQPPLSFIR
jgi:hypothetical protein